MKSQMPVATKTVKSTKMKQKVDPDVDGCRFCRHCKKRLPISAFPAGARRYVCKAHLYELVKLPSKLRAEADDKRRVLGKLWARCRTDSKAFGQTRIQLMQSEIEDILHGDGKTIDLAFAIVPTDVSRVLSRENAAVVPNEARRALIWTHRLGGERMYLEALAGWRAANSSQGQRAEEALDGGFDEPEHEDDPREDKNLQAYSNWVDECKCTGKVTMQTCNCEANCFYKWLDGCRCGDKATFENCKCDARVFLN